MSKRFLVCFFLLTTPLWGAPDPVQWPEGSGRELVKKNCLLCHSGDIIVGQRLSRELWTKEVDKMAAWGSPIPEEQRVALVDYLVAHFSADEPFSPELRARYSF